MKEKSSSNSRLTRRDLLFQIGGLGLCGVVGHGFPLLAQVQQTGTQQPSAGQNKLSVDDDAFLDDLEKRNFQYFWDQAGSQTGLVRDRCNVLKDDNSVVASIAATGFGLTALCIGQQARLYFFF